jgi:hypothetical protein
MIDTHRIYEWMERPEKLDRDTLHELRALVDRYPYFQTARLLYLRNLIALRHPDLEDELRKVAIYVADRKQLFRTMEAERALLVTEEGRIETAPTPVAEAEKQETVPAPESAGINEEAPKKNEGKSETPDRTLTLIDNFLLEMGAPADPARPKPELPADLATYLIQDLPDAPQTAEPMPGQQLIDKFLQEDAPEAQSDPVEEPQESVDDEEAEKTENDPEEDYFTETLAKIYIKQQRYSKALEIIKKINLKYPKKNVYFADQIRFLEKLIINNKSK